MKSADADEICFADEMKSTRREPRFHPTEGRISSSKMIYPTPWVDFVKFEVYITSNL